MEDVVTKETNLTVQVTLVAVVIDVNARAQRLAEHPEVATQGGPSNPLKAHTHHVGCHRTDQVYSNFIFGFNKVNPD